MRVVKGNFDKLKGFLNKTQDADDGYSDKAYELCVKADALRIKNYFLESIEEYQKILKFNKNYADAHKGMGIAYKHLKDYKNAIKSLEQARKLTPFAKEVYYELGLCYMKQNKGCPAIKSFVKAVKLDHEHYDALFNMAAAHEMIDEPEMAEMIYKKVIDNRPSYIAAYNNLGSLSIRQGKFLEAIKTFKKLIEINPEFIRANLGIAVAFDKMDKLSDARRYYKKYLEKKPNAGNAPYILDRINDIRLEKPNTKNSHLKLVEQ